MTKRTLNIGTQTLATHCAERVSHHADWLLQSVQRFEARGKGLADGVRLQIGWSLLTLRERGGELWVCEPDFSTDPFHHIREDVTCTLMVLTQQQRICTKVNVAPQALRFDDHVRIAPGGLIEPRLFMTRRQPTKAGESGWSVDVQGQPTPAMADSIRVYQLLKLRPELLAVMLLPAGYKATFKDDQIQSVINPTGEDVWTI